MANGIGASLINEEKERIVEIVAQKTEPAKRVSPTVIFLAENQPAR
jgi:hypothetical protein